MWGGWVVHNPSKRCFRKIPKAIEAKGESGENNIFFTRIDENEEDRLGKIIGYTLGFLPVKYLSVPLITKKLKKDDCKCLMDKIFGRISSWRNKFSSSVGRIVLIRLVLMSIQFYWSSIFMRPSSIHKKIERKIRAFLWSGVNLEKHKAKVARDEVCLPIKEGGLGIFRTKWH